MVKTKVDLKDMPSWASNYMNSIDVGGLTIMYFLKPMKVTLREQGLALLFKLHNLPDEVRDQIYFNKKGDLVFTWKSKGHRDMFILKWSSI